MLRLLARCLSEQAQTAVLQQPWSQVPSSIPQQWQVYATAIRMASSRKSKKKPDLKGYDYMLHQWKSAQGSKRSKTSAGAKHHRHASSTSWFEEPYFADSSSGRKRSKKNSSNSSRGKQRSAGDFQWQGSYKQAWSDANLAEAAAAAQLHPDEFHNLVFGKDSDYYSSSSTAEGRKQRRKAKKARHRAKRMQQTAKAWGYASYTFSDTESESDDEWQQHWQQRPDWQWWDEQQEREWFEQAWRQSGGQQRWQQHWSQQDSSSSSSYSSSNSRPWWESFEQHYQRHQQQYSQRQQQHQHQQQWQQQQQRSGSWQQAGPATRHPPSVLEHLAVLGLPADIALQRAQLKAAFHKAAMQWHPDMHAGEGQKAAAEVKFKQVKEAYESLVSRAVA